ncbi:amidohydrolase family protein [Bradyrhizobium sp. ORS 111]|uniref:metal-dependent hydrolase family protein n=1 Tax=Bradyrhizobium sp. ORS 111 TaxID=1685958 RepID=UPI00388F5C59
MPSILFKNASVLLDGEPHLRPNLNVLVSDNRIEAVTDESVDRPDMTIIDVAGMTLMPGLIDAHAHVTGLSLSPKNLTYPGSEIAMAAASYLHSSLKDGFTTIREAGGADYGIARLLKEGKILGPRLFYSGKALTQTGGGADFRTPTEVTDPCGHVTPMSVMSMITDGVDAVRQAAREELRKGATQIKVFVSGGVVFPAEGTATRYEFSEAELLAVVEEAAARGTYVMAHVYTDEGAQRCLRSGVRSIEHGNFMEESTVAKMRDAEAFFDPTFISLVQRVETADEMGLSREIVANLKRTIDRGKQVYSWAKQRGVPIALGTDLWGPEAQKSQLRELEVRLEFDSPQEILKSATTTNAELLLQKGKLGVIAPDAYADLLIVDGNPLLDLRVLLDPSRNLKLIMKDGIIVKNELAR